MQGSEDHSSGVVAACNQGRGRADDPRRPSSTRPRTRRARRRPRPRTFSSKHHHLPAREGRQGIASDKLPRRQEAGDRDRAPGEARKDLEGGDTAKMKGRAGEPLLEGRRGRYAAAQAGPSRPPRPRARAAPRSPRAPRRPRRRPTSSTRTSKWCRRGQDEKVIFKTFRRQRRCLRPGGAWRFKTQPNPPSTRNPHPYGQNQNQAHRRSHPCGNSSTQEKEQVRHGGIIIPDSAKEKPQEAEVIALGTGKKDESGKTIAFDVKVGDRVLISKYGGSEVKIDEGEVHARPRGRPPRHPRPEPSPSPPQQTLNSENKIHHAPPNNCSSTRPARQKILRGVELLSRAVKVTLGPEGRNVVIDKKFGSPTVTKDGVTRGQGSRAPRSLREHGRADGGGGSLPRPSDAAGDGTTTATILAESIYKEGLKNVTAGCEPDLS